MSKKTKRLALSLLFIANYNSVFEAADYTSTVTINDGASHLFLGDTTITTTSGHGLVLSGPMGSVSVDPNTDFTITANSGTGISVINSAGTLQSGNASISLGETHIASNSYGIHASTADNPNYAISIVLGDDSTITAQSTALNIMRNSTVTIGNNSTISGNTSGPTVAAVSAANGAVINIGNDATITNTSTNGNSMAVRASDASGSTLTGATITIGNGATIYTSSINSGSHAVKAGNTTYLLGSGTIEIGNDANISTVGSSSYGLYAENNSSIILGNDAQIQTSGNNSSAVRSGTAASLSWGPSSDTGGGTIEIGEGLEIITTGTSGYGLDARYNGSVIIVGKDATITTIGDYAYGVYAISSGDITLGDNATITTTGTNSHGIYTGSGSSTTLNGATIWVDDSKGSKAIYTTTTGNVHGSGLFHITGDIVNSASGTIDLGFLSGSQFIGASDVGTGTINLDMADAARWQMTKDSTVTKLEFLSGGAVSFDTASNYGILTVDQLIGDGGTFYMRTDLVGDGAGSNQGDLLNVATSSVGDHFIQVANSGSAVTDGTETLTLVDTADGIATFALTNTVELGGYQYDLQRTLADPTDWELYSTGEVSSTTDAGVNLFSGAYLLNYAETQTLLKRLGDLRGGAQDNGIWARVYGGKFQSSGDGFLRGFDMNYWGMQAGYDKKIEREDKKGTVYVGGFLGYSKGNLDYLTDGSGSIDSKSLGAYWTHIHRNGFYADAVLKYNWMKNDFKRLDTAGDMVSGSDINTQGFTGSLEVGRRYFFNKTENGEKIRVEDRQGWYVEPQMQVTVGQQSGGSFAASNGLNIKVDSFRSVMGRVGTHLGYEVKGGKNPINVYGKVSVVKEFDGDVNYSLNGSKEMTSYKDTWVVYGVGATAKLGTRHNLYLDVERATGGQFTQSWAVNGGYRFSW